MASRFDWVKRPENLLGLSKTILTHFQYGVTVPGTLILERNMLGLFLDKFILSHLDIVLLYI